MNKLLKKIGDVFLGFIDFIKEKVKKITSPNNNNKKSFKRRDYLFVYLMLIIAVLGMVKYIWVNINSILLSFSIENDRGEQIASLDNFRRLFGELADKDSGVILYLTNTLKYFFLYLIKILLGWAVAYFIFKKILGYKWFRVIFYLPSIISPIVLANVFKNLLTDGGLINRIVTLGFGKAYSNPFGSTSLATPTLLFYCLWSGFGEALLIFVGAMNRIPGEVLDSGRIDGCDSMREFFLIITPLVWGTLSTMLLLTIMGVFTATGPILYFTAGNCNTSTISFWIFYQTYNGTYNYPTAVGLFFTVIAIPIVFGSRFLMNLVDSKVNY